MRDKQGLLRSLLKLLGSLFVSMCVISPTALAQDLQTTIERVSQAYSVEKLERAKTIRLESDRRFPFGSHDYSVDFPDLTKHRYHFVLDIKNQRVSHEYLTEISRTSYHGRIILKDGKSIHIHYGPDSYQDNGESDFFAAFGSVFRSSDVLLALWLANPKSNARYIGDAMWLGYPHDVVEMDFPNSLPLTVYVRRKDGGITKMERTVSDGRKVYYTFQNHEKRGDILIAREHSFYIEDERSYFSFNRDVDINDRQDRRAFDLGKNIVPEAERTDQSEMGVLLLSKGNNTGQSIHQVCQEDRCTTFMVVGEIVIGFGMGAGFTDRFDAYKQKTGVTRPLQYVIAADHQDADISGAQDARDIGATLMVTEQAAQKLRNGSDDYKLEVVTKEKNIGDLRIIPIATDHAATVLVAYHKKQKLLMQTGHYFSPFINEPSYIRQISVSLYEAIPDDIRADTVAILSGQDIKAEKWSDFVSAMKKFEEIRCHRNRPICKR